MKGLLITAAIVGAAVTALIFYGTDDTTLAESGTSDIDEAAEDAYKTMNKHIGRVERKTEEELNNALG